MKSNKSARVKHEIKCYLKTISYGKYIKTLAGYDSLINITQFQNGKYKGYLNIEIKRRFLF